MSKFFYYFKRILVILLVIAISFILQTAVFSHLKLAGIVPNILVMITAFAGFLNGREEGMLVGFLSGIVADFYMGQWFGMFALICLFIGFLNGSFRTAFFGDDIKLPLLYVALSDIIYGIIIYISMYLTRQQYDFLYYFLNIIMPETMYTIIISIICYIPMFRLSSWIHKNTPRSTRSIG